MRQNELRDAVVAALGTGPLTVPELRIALGEPWTTEPPDRDELDRLLQFDTTFTEVAAGVAHVPSVLKGTTWTVWVDPDDAADEFVRTQPWLSPLVWWLIGDDVALIGDNGARLGELETDGWILDGVDTDVVLGPEGWLVDLAGGWARVEVVDGGLCWSPLTEPPAATPAQVAAVRLGFERAMRRDSETAFDLGTAPAGSALHVRRGADS